MTPGRVAAGGVAAAGPVAAAEPVVAAGGVAAAGPVAAAERGTGGRDIVILACGEPLRGDDSVAPRAVAGMDAASLGGSRVRLIGALEPEHLVDLPAGTALVIVDAVVGVEPGRIVELDLRELATHDGRVVTTSTHQLPLDRVVALGQLLRDEPLPGRFVGVGIADVRPGASLSGPTADALAAVRAAVTRAVAALQAGSTLAGP
jgi:hydrogenase maturation protease